MRKKIIIQKLKKHNIIAKEKEICFLGQGENNKNYLIQNKIVFRECLGPISAKKQAEILKKLPNNIGPKLLYEDKNFLLLEYIKGRTLKRLSLEKLKKIVTLLATFHKPSKKVSYSISQKFEKEFIKWKTEKKYYKCFDELAIITKDKLKFYDDSFQKTPQCLIHTDACLTNIIFTPKYAKLIDWEWARIGDPAHDLALIGYSSFQIPPWYTSLTKVKEEIIVATYLKYHKDQTLKKRIQAWRIWQAFFDFGHFSRIVDEYKQTKFLTKAEYIKKRNLCKKALLKLI